MTLTAMHSIVQHRRALSTEEAQIQTTTNKSPRALSRLTLFVWRRATGILICMDARKSRAARCKTRRLATPKHRQPLLYRLMDKWPVTVVHADTRSPTSMQVVPIWDVHAHMHALMQSVNVYPLSRPTSGLFGLCTLRTPCTISIAALQLGEDACYIKDPTPTGSTRFPTSTLHSGNFPFLSIHSHSLVDFFHSHFYFARCHQNSYTQDVCPDPKARSVSPHLPSVPTRRS